MATKKEAPKLEVRTVSYIKPDETIPTVRSIITADKEQTHLHSLDVSDLAPELQQKIAEHYTLYQEKLKAHIKEFPTFAAFVTANNSVPDYAGKLFDPALIKWRSFAVNRILTEQGGDK